MSLKQEVLDAYKKTGLTPKDGSFFDFVDKEIGVACVAGVLYLSANGVKRETVVEIDRWLLKHYAGNVVHSLIRGFDGNLPSTLPEFHDQHAYDTGLELRKELLNKGLVA